MDRKDSVGFIGLGMMGIHMATNILRKGFPLIVRDIAPARCEALAAEGAQVADSPAAVAEKARITVLMVDTTAQVEEVIFGAEGIARQAQPGDRIICMSTIDPEAVRGFARELRPLGVGLIDAPVSGMEKGAREGTLKAFVGGAAEDLEACRPVLDAMTAQVIHLGDAGQGLAMKLVNNMLVQVGWVAVAEALVLGQKAGLDPEQMVSLIGEATGNSVAFQYMGPRWLERDFDGIRLDVTFKDMGHQIELGKSLGVPMMMATLAQQMYQLARCKGYGSEDGVAVVKVYEEMARLIDPPGQET
ncbi:NAD(P)-dependent oxidoreductase [Celeribacter indicus]|uniref:6-phosphogluconate dehydrogenase n=1 Tax=Celeribacter indicus TaxID=1208324 RepID=A0A0B5E1L0_9RHOB|nr:NAD(P)-dependent oxidoreductase [Celeribacter indicus]AJE49139.1 6-phosphogluconate dehydrogenase [Celeribacter indicus]SDX17396.1 3-hydroxyisobutyrate dehydrogenase [Celeribacter indicus]